MRQFLLCIAICVQGLIVSLSSVSLNGSRTVFVFRMVFGKVKTTPNPSAGCCIEQVYIFIIPPIKKFVEKLHNHFGESGI